MNSFQRICTLKVILSAVSPAVSAVCTRHCSNVSLCCKQVQLRAGDMSYSAFLSKADSQAQVPPYVADAYDTCNILFSSGTTGASPACCQFTFVKYHRPVSMDLWISQLCQYTPVSVNKACHIMP